MDDFNKKILLIEDDEAMLQALYDIFAENGFLVYKARDGQEGLMVALKEHPDIILLDILMPRMDGLIMMKKLRKDEWGKTVPIVLLTNVTPDSDSTIRSIVEHKPAYYLIKSDVTLEATLEKVQDVLATRSGE